MLAFYLFRDYVVSLEGCESHKELWKKVAEGLALEYNLPPDIEDSLGDLTRAVTHGFYEDNCLYLSDIVSVRQLEVLTERFGKCRARYTEECMTCLDQAELLEQVLSFAEVEDDQSLPDIGNFAF